MDIKYADVLPLRTSPCLAWLIEWSTGGVDVLMTSADMKVEDVIHMLKVHSHDDFMVSNITVGQLPVDPRWRDPVLYQEFPKHLQDLYTIYSGEGRKIDSDGMVQV